MANLDLISDLHKDVYGYRPRGTLAEDINQLPQKAFEIYFQDLVDELQLVVARDQRQEAKALKDYMQRLVSMMRDYKITMHRALVWDADGFGFPDEADEGFDLQGFEHYLWKQGIAYKEWPTFVSVMKQEMDVTIEELDARIHNEK